MCVHIMLCTSASNIPLEGCLFMGKKAGNAESDYLPAFEPHGACLALICVSLQGTERDLTYGRLPVGVSLTET